MPLIGRISMLLEAAAATPPADVAEEHTDQPSTSEVASGWQVEVCICHNNVPLH